MLSKMTPKSSIALVVGAEGLIGSALYDCLVPNYTTVYGTSRRVQNRKNFIQIDLSNNFDELSKIASRCNIAFICAAITKVVECDNNRTESYAVNVTNTLKMVKIFQDLGVFVVWLSSNYVFSGERPFCGLDEPYMPLTEYGRQKADAEQKILELGGVAIVRMTKVLSKDYSIISDWVKDIKDGKEIYPFSDAYFSPISLNYATHAIVKVGVNLRSGIFNISGSDDISYSDFARMLAVKLCGCDDLVKPINKDMTNSKMYDTGRYGSLDMKEITNMVDIKPQLCDDLLEDILCMKIPNIKAALENETGCLTGLHFTQEELTKIRSLVTSSWLLNISNKTSPQIAGQFEAAGINRYHDLAHLLDHGSMWPKVSRILDSDAVAEIRGMSLMQMLEDEFGHFEISGEENVEHEEMIWRLVRPNSPSDVGPFHADAWFWALPGHGITPPGCKRVKVWIAIYCDPGKDGFKFVPGSHKHEWPYHVEFRNKTSKPKIDISDDELESVIFNSQPGEAIIFNDKLLHTGALGLSETRVSLEFTMFIKNENYYT